MKDLIQQTIKEAPEKKTMIMIMILFSEAVIQKCSLKNLLLKISQNSQENNCVGVSFAGLKKRIQHRCFPANVAKFL